jgi:MinD-like ATPase involved in chromosome partitioning or flagellar assembly
MGEGGMKAITFFSYKGGNGRTLTAANFAVYLTKLGLKVVIMDFDLDAPGVDSKFPDFTLPKGQLGLIDYVLQFQRDGAPPGPIHNIHCSMAVKSPRQDYSLGLIPAGDYLGSDYPAKLNELSWATIFSPHRDGVAFFQLFLQQIEKELKPDVLVIDSRTGFSEIGGLCTQQLADETVILSSLASESVKMTRHLAHVIRGSEISKHLNKSVETKVVVCRVPKPRDVEKLKSRCCKMFDVEESKLFFLFSCPRLEQEEFVAMMDTRKEEGLSANYLKLFQGLDVEVARKSIRAEIERTESGLLSCSAEEAEARIREMVALYPDAEVYRRAMRFFQIGKESEDATLLALRLLDLDSDDQDAQLQVARFVLRGEPGIAQFPLERRSRAIAEVADVRRLVSICEHAYANHRLSTADAIQLADILEDINEHEKSFQIAWDVLKTGKFENPELRGNAMAIAARTAMRIGKKEEAVKLLPSLPVSMLRGSLARLAVQTRIEKGEKKEALELARTLLSRDLDRGIIDIAVELAMEQGRIEEIKELVRTHPHLESGEPLDPATLMVLERLGLDVRENWERLHAGRRRHPRP